jgi:broad specificity phosphatase PhoE
MIRLLLGRHGETDWNRDGRWQGHADGPLNARGRHQALQLAARIARLQPVALYSSDLARARQTAELVSEATGLPVVASPGIREVDVGEWTGYTRSEVEARFPERYAAYQHDGGTGYPGGETFAALGRRSLATVDAFCAGHSDGDVIAIICHGGTIRALTAAALKLPRAGRILTPGPENCSVSQLAWSEGRLRVISYNDTGHLASGDLV